MKYFQAVRDLIYVFEGESQALVMLELAFECPRKMEGAIVDEALRSRFPRSGLYATPGEIGGFQNFIRIGEGGVPHCGLIFTDPELSPTSPEKNTQAMVPRWELENIWPIKDGGVALSADGAFLVHAGLLDLRIIHKGRLSVTCSMDAAYASELESEAHQALKESRRGGREEYQLKRQERSEKRRDRQQKPARIVSVSDAGELIIEGELGSHRWIPGQEALGAPV